MMESMTTSYTSRHWGVGSAERLNKMELYMVVRWYTFVILAFGRQRKGDYCKFRTSLVYMVHSRTTGAT